MEKPPEPPKPKQQQIQRGPSEELLELTARLRMNESRYNELNSKVEMLEQNMIIKTKKLTGEIKQIKDSIKEFQDKVDEVSDKMTTIVNEIKLLARKEDVNVLKKYADYWNPIKFVTLNHFNEELVKIKKTLKNPKQ